MLNFLNHMVNFDMSAEIRDYLKNEFILLDRLIKKHHPLIEIAHSEVPEDFYITTLGAMLHGYYCGIENLFKRIALDIDGEFSKSNSWHKLLLDRMSMPYKDRPAVISPELRKKLHMYLDFRHVFRGIYSFDLSWNKMKELVLNCEETLCQLKKELNSFVECLDDK